jgi:hypothetical protein
MLADRRWGRGRSDGGVGGGAGGGAGEGAGAFSRLGTLASPLFCLVWVAARIFLFFVNTDSFAIQVRRRGGICM